MDSLDPLSSPSSISSHASAESYESLKQAIINIEENQIDLRDLVDAADKIIKNKFSTHPQIIFTYKKGSVKISVNLSAVMSAMLACAEESGGKSGRRCVASAIFACGRKEGDGDVVEALAALSTTWLIHLLFLSSRRYEIQPNLDHPDSTADDIVCWGRGGPQEWPVPA